jgi:hypothetical protein
MKYTLLDHVHSVCESGLTLIEAAEKIWINDGYKVDFKIPESGTEWDGESWDVWTKSSNGNWCKTNRFSFGSNQEVARNNFFELVANNTWYDASKWGIVRDGQHLSDSFF